jgi:four helix bundle protein
MHSFKELKVWQKAIMLNTSIYEVTKLFPKEELYGLTNQMRRAAVSVASNIAEGSRRNSKREFSQFLGIAKGSLAELETQAIIASNVGVLSGEIMDRLASEFDELSRMLLGLQRSQQQ